MKIIIKQNNEVMLDGCFSPIGKLAKGEKLEVLDEQQSLQYSKLNKTQYINYLKLIKKKVDNMLKPESINTVAYKGIIKFLEEKSSS